MIHAWFRDFSGNLLEEPSQKFSILVDFRRLVLQTLITGSLAQNLVTILCLSKNKNKTKTRSLVTNYKPTVRAKSCRLW